MDHGLFQAERLDSHRSLFQPSLSLRKICLGFMDHEQGGLHEEGGLTRQTLSGNEISVFTQCQGFSTSKLAKVFSEFMVRFVEICKGCGLVHHECYSLLCKSNT